MKHAMARPWPAMAVLCLGTFAVRLDTAIVNVALPPSEQQGAVPQSGEHQGRNTWVRRIPMACFAHGGAGKMPTVAELISYPVKGCAGVPLGEADHQGPPTYVDTASFGLPPRRASGWHLSRAGLAGSSGANTSPQGASMAARVRAGERLPVFAHRVTILESTRTIWATSVGSWPVPPSTALDGNVIHDDARQR
jgi:hypothetical protein